jgi:hypothetical protein
VPPTAAPGLLASTLPSTPTPARDSVTVAPAGAVPSILTFSWVVGWLIGIDDVALSTSVVN